MTWRELKRKIEVMPAEQLDQEIKCWGEHLAPTTAQMDVCEENMFAMRGEEFCSSESELSDWEKDHPDYEIVMTEGTWFLRVKD